MSRKHLFYSEGWLLLCEFFFGFYFFFLFLSLSAFVGQSGGTVPGHWVPLTSDFAAFQFLQEAIIGGLQSETTYSVAVAAYTTKGDGARTKAKVITTTGAGQLYHSSVRKTHCVLHVLRYRVDSFFILETKMTPSRAEPNIPIWSLRKNTKCDLISLQFLVDLLTSVDR